MRKLRAFRPEGVEGLEERLVLSHAAAEIVHYAARVQYRIRHNGPRT